MDLHGLIRFSDSFCTICAYVRYFSRFWGEGFPFSFFLHIFSLTNFSGLVSVVRYLTGECKILHEDQVG